MSIHRSKISLVCGCASVSLGGVVLFGWYTHWLTLILAHQSSGFMQYNTALGFLVCGIGLVLANLSRSRPVAICGLFLTGLGGLTLIQYLLEINLGIDQLLMKDYIIAGTSYPGRMAPNTALFFMLTGTALLIMSRPGEARKIFPIAGIFGAMILALSAVALSGYLVGLETAYGWGNLTRMAVHTAAGFVVLGIGVIAFAWRNSAEGEKGIPRWAPALVAIGFITVAISLWQALAAQERTHLEAKIKLKIKIVKKEILGQLEFQVLALSRMAQRWEVRGKPPRKEWESDARNYVKHHSIYQAIEWVDPSFHVRWIVPLAGNEEALGLESAFEGRRRAALEKARNLNIITVTRAINLVQGGKGFLIYVPIFHAGEFGGFILGVIHLKEWLDNTLEGEETERISIALFDGEEEIYNSAHTDDRWYEEEWGQEITLDFYGASWRMRVWPNEEWLAEEENFLPEAVLALGLLMALLLAMSVYFSQRERLHSREIASANLELEKEIDERRRAKEKLRASLREKEVLLQEVHHRAKNNMQVIASLLKLQSKYTKDKNVAEMFRESHNRIRSMALIHETIFNSSDLEKIDSYKYIQSLVNALFRSYGCDTDRIDLKIKTHGISLSVDNGIPCGLIINELVSNSLKYAFPEPAQGCIEITLRPLDGENIELIVRDDGVGVSGNLDFRNTPSLGLQLVTTLAEDQLGGKIELRGNGGAEFKIVFNRRGK